MESNSYTTNDTKKIDDDSQNQSNFNLTSQTDCIKAFLQQIESTTNTSFNSDVITNTPMRFVKAFEEFTSGYKIDPKELIQSALFDSEGYDDIVILEDIEFNSTCEHHLLPFMGKVRIAYVPGEKILGLSKFGRLVEAFSRRLSLQERLTMEIAKALDNFLLPKGVIVEIVAEHTCMMIRGVKNKTSKTKTVYTTGCFKQKDFYDKFNHMK